MIKSILASNASKLVASCVCPVAGTVALTVGVPPVRDAVHRATAPRAYALPKTRVRQSPAAATSAPVQTAALQAPPCEPVLTAGPIGTPFTPSSLGEVPAVESIRRLTDAPIVGGGTGPVVDNNLVLPPSSPVPEPRQWVQLLIGFGVIGAAARHTLKAGGKGKDASADV